MTEPIPHRRPDWDAINELRHGLRVLAPLATQVAQHDVEIDALRDGLAVHSESVRETIERIEEDMRERFDRVFGKLDRIDMHVQRTNGRVTDLERDQIARQAREQAVAELTVRGERVTVHNEQRSDRIFDRRLKLIGTVFAAAATGASIVGLLVELI